MSILAAVVAVSPPIRSMLAAGAAADVAVGALAVAAEAVVSVILSAVVIYTIQYHTQTIYVAYCKQWERDREKVQRR